MINWNNANVNLSALLAEDVGAPELRSPKISGIRPLGWLARLLGRKG